MNSTTFDDRDDRSDFYNDTYANSTALDGYYDEYDNYANSTVLDGYYDEYDNYANSTALDGYDDEWNPVRNETDQMISNTTDAEYGYGYYFDKNAEKKEKDFRWKLKSNP